MMWRADSTFRTESWNRVAELAFPRSDILQEAKIAILAASVVAGIVGYVVLRLAPNRA